MRYHLFLKFFEKVVEIKETSFLLSRCLVSIGQHCKCNLCGLQFKTSSALNQHCKRIHENNNLCSLCGKKFHSEEYLKKHILYKCGNRWVENKCSNCNMNFESRTQTLEHIASEHKGKIL